MKRLQFLASLVILLMVASCGSNKTITTTTPSTSKRAKHYNAQDAYSIMEKLKKLPHLVGLTILENNSHFKEHYELWFEQPIDHNDPSKGTFQQRVLLAHVNPHAPVIVELQGYQIYSQHTGELAKLFKANQLTIEHRFFANSGPEELPWQSLTIENAAADQHRIISAIKEIIYPQSKILTTGISKGGQTTMIHRSLYPDDADISVCYVAPLNFAKEDTRIYDFLANVGTAEERELIFDFQKRCFQRKGDLLNELTSLARKKGFSWKFGPEKALEYYILEYSFAFWQWGEFKISDIPMANARTKDVLNHLLAVSGISFFEDAGVLNLQPFFWAANTQLGMYGYETAPFSTYLGTDEIYTFDFTMPAGESYEYSSTPMENVNDYIQNQAEKMMFIYGELDTWSATAVQLSEASKARGNHKFVHKGGHHGTRIYSFPPDEQQRIISILEEWLDMQSMEE